MKARAVDTELTVSQRHRFLIVELPGVHRVASWAIVGGGLGRATQIVWHEVDESELCPPIDARALLRARLAEQGVRGAVGLLTGCQLEHYVDRSSRHGEVVARCIVTAGLSNALRIGDQPGHTERVGTINLLCWLSVPLGEGALLEALSLATEARTTAVLEANVVSRRSGMIASGTGTDCIVVASPIADQVYDYAGKHTDIGHVVGDSVYRAVSDAAQVWLRAHGQPRQLPSSSTIPSAGETARCTVE